ncbi:DUF1398 family protein, partial [Escherichia coli]|uniref:DUF1398 family protein n=1 Tax=Escherichia coli TaxID=562 RepID=UPI001D096D59
MDQVVVFQKMFEQVRKEQNFSWFYSELKHHRIAYVVISFLIFNWKDILIILKSKDDILYTLSIVISENDF